MALTEKQLERNRKAALKSTGPKTPEGKAKTSMNALKTGENLDIMNFYKIQAKHAGNLKLCDPCGDEQKDICKQAGSCLLHDTITLRYIKAYQENDLRHIEEINILHLASMDMIFNQKLRYAQMHMMETETVTDENGKKRKKPIIDMQYMYLLLNMAKHLSKSLPDMKLTRQTQEMIDTEWAKLALAEIDIEKATEFKQKILNQLSNWRENKIKVERMEDVDPAIQDHRKQENMQADEEIDFTIGNIDNPFSSKNG